MAKLQRSQLFPSTSGITDSPTKIWADKIIRFLDDVLKKISSIPFNRSEELTVSDTGTANATFSVTHHIGRLPTGYIVSFIDKAAVVYCDSTDLANWSTSEIKLKCNTANTKVEIVVF